MGYSERVLSSFSMRSRQLALVSTLRVSRVDSSFSSFMDSLFLVPSICLNATKNTISHSRSLKISGLNPS